MSNKLALANAVSIVEMEGLYLSDKGYELCRKYSEGDLSWDDFWSAALDLINSSEI